MDFGMINQKIAATVAEYPQDDWSLVFSAVLTGLVVVFFILAVLVGVLYLMGALIGEKKKKVEPNAEKTAPVAAEIAPEVEEYDDFDDSDEEIVAVISAAIAAYSEQDGVQYTIRKIKRADKQSRSNWGIAGVNENTRPF